MKLLIVENWENSHIVFEGILSSIAYEEKQTLTTD